VRRRDFIAGFGGAVTWPLAARAQQPPMPAIGMLQSTTPPLAPDLMAAFRKGLNETGYVEGRNLVIEFSWAADELDRLPDLAADLVRRRVAVICTPGTIAATRAAKAATTTIPVVFSMGGDPIQTGVVANLNRPGGHITGYGEMNTEVWPKRFGLLHELAPQAARFAVLLNPKNAAAELVIGEAQKAAAAIGQPIEVLTASTDREIDAVFLDLVQKRASALVVANDALFYGRRDQVTTLAARHAVPAIYWDRAFLIAGGLMSYGSSIADGFRQVGIYTGRILNGERPADLPVMLATKFELAINMKTAKTLGLAIPETLLATADEVIQ
jgi:putative tryptophan/tyrosine transport system substrate-binding protein